MPVELVALVLNAAVPVLSVDDVSVASMAFQDWLSSQQVTETPETGFPLASVTTMLHVAVPPLLTVGVLMVREAM